MDYIVRFSALVIMTFLLLFFATDKWAKYNTWLMAGYMLAAGAIFLW